MIVAGLFDEVAGKFTRNIARLNVDGTIDSTFNSPAVIDGPISLVLPQPGRKIVIAGGFTSVDGFRRDGIARLNTDGSLDSQFDAAGLSVTSMINTTDDKIIVGARGEYPVLRLHGGNLMPGPPIITRTSQSQSLSSGANVTFTVNVATASIPSYQWQRNGVMLPGTTNPVLTLTNVRTSDAGKYQVAVRNAQGETVSSDVLLQVAPVPNTPGALDPDLNPGVGANGAIRSVAVQLDGHLVIVGDFTSYGGIARLHIARVHADGSLDEGFDAGATLPGLPHFVGVLPDGGIIASETARNETGTFNTRVVRFTDSGLLMTSVLLDGAYEFLLAIQPDGKLLVRKLDTVVRLNPDGTLDPTFDSSRSRNPYSAQIRAAVVQPDGKILVGGYFPLFQGQSRPNLARLHPDGRLDRGFVPEIPSGEQAAITTIALQPDGKIWAGGPGLLRRFSCDGTLDFSVPLSLYAESNRFVMYLSTAVEPGSSLILAGDFVQIGAVPRRNLARLKTGQPQSGPPVIRRQPVSQQAREGDTTELSVIVESASCPNYQWRQNGRDLPGETSRILVFRNVRAAQVGVYSVVISNAVGTVQSREASLAVEPAPVSPGSVSIDFGGLEGPDHGVGTFLKQPDGRILVGGSFRTFDGEPRSGLARINSLGDLDPTFLPPELDRNGAIIGIGALALQSDGKLLAGGTFTTVSGRAQGGIMRLRSDGSLDGTFDPQIGPSATFSTAGVRAILIQSDGAVLVGGLFDRFNGRPWSALVRLRSDGGLDETFRITLTYAGATNPTSLSSVYALATVGNGMTLVGGSFGLVNGHPRPGLVRLTAEGNVDLDFVPAYREGYVANIVLEPSGTLLLGGNFFVTGGLNSQAVIRLRADGQLDRQISLEQPITWLLGVQPDGMLLGYTYRQVLRFFPDGVLDRTFAARLGDSGFARTALWDDGILVGGEFEEINETPRRNLAKLQSAGPSVLRLLGPSLDERGFTALIQTVDGKTYALEFKDSLSEPSWTNVTNVIGDGKVLILMDGSGVKTQRFYRVRSD